MPVDIRPATLRDVTYIAANMREQDWREISCLTNETRLGIGALSYLAAPEFTYVAWYRGDPVTAFGISPSAIATCWIGWAYGRSLLPRTIPAITRFFRSTLRQRALDVGIRRVEVRSIIDHDVSHRWLTGMGATREAELPDYGMTGETFVLYSWTRKTTNVSV